MEDEKKDDMIEYTTEVKQGHAAVGKFNIVIDIILVIVCVVYLILHFRP